MDKVWIVNCGWSQCPNMMLMSHLGSTRKDSVGNRAQIIPVLTEDWPVSCWSYIVARFKKNTGVQTWPQAAKFHHVYNGTTIGQQLSYNLWSTVVIFLIVSVSMKLMMWISISVWKAWKQIFLNVIFVVTVVLLFFFFFVNLVLFRRKDVYITIIAEELLHETHEYYSLVIEITLRIGALI